MNRIWPLRNFANFTLTVIGVTGLGMIYYSTSNERVFSNSPVVSQAVRVMNHHNAIRNLIGYPVTYSGSFSNSYNIKDEQQYYNFQVKGSKSHTTTQLNATRMKVSDINLKIQRVAKIQNLIKQKLAEVDQKKQTIKKLNKKQQALYLKDIQNIQSDILNLQNDLKQAQAVKIQCLKKFYIPDEDLYQKVVRNKNPEATIDPETYLYGIDALTANLPNKKTINIIPEQEVNIRQDKNVGLDSNKKFLQAQKITEGYLKNMLHQNIGDLSQAEIQSYGKHKKMLMYGKYNSYRVGFTILATFGIGMILVAWHKFRIRSISGTSIAYHAEQFFFNHPKTNQILKALKKPKQNVKFSKTFLGGRKDDSFNCSVDIEGLPGGKVYFEGTYKEGEGEIKFKKLQFEYRENTLVKKVDLMA